MDFPARSRVAIGRIVVATTGFGVAAIVAYRIPVWLHEWTTWAVTAAAVTAVIVLATACRIAVRGSPRTVRRATVEIVLLAGTLLVAEATLLWGSPESWSEDPRVQREIVQARRARQGGIRYDERVRAEVASDLRRLGLPAMSGFSADMSAHPSVAAAVVDRGLLPLSNASRTYIVECNEGLGFLQFQSDELGFNNPPGLALGPATIAVFGESLALGHCVPPGVSVVDLVRARFPRTANFGVPGARVLSELAVFREYVEPLRPELVVWFVNVSYAEAGREREVQILKAYLDPSFSQGLRQRQDEVDSFVREVLEPLRVQEEARLKQALVEARRFPLARVFELREIRGLIELGRPMDPEKSDLRHFQRALDLVVRASRKWGGRLLVVVLPGLGISTREPQSLERYHAVRAVLEKSGVPFVDGPRVFAGVGNVRRLYALGLDNHPSERGHALLADALIEAIQQEDPP